MEFHGVSEQAVTGGGADVPTLFERENPVDGRPCEQYRRTSGGVVGVDRINHVVGYARECPRDLRPRLVDDIPVHLGHVGETQHPEGERLVPMEAHILLERRASRRRPTTGSLDAAPHPFGVVARQSTRDHRVDLCLAVGEIPIQRCQRDVGVRSDRIDRRATKSVA